MANKNVLLLDGDGTQTLPIPRSLFRKGYRVHATFRTKLNYGYFSRYISKRHLISSADLQIYCDALADLLREIRFEAVIPLSDVSAELLCRYESQLKPYTHYVMPDYVAFDAGYDKHKLMILCQKKGYPHPKTVFVDREGIDAVALENLEFPLLIKPNYTCGGRGMTLVKNREELLQKYPSVHATYGDCHLQRFIPAGGAQVEVQLYVDEQGQLLYSSVIRKFRWYPENGGSSCCNISDDNPYIVGVCHRILKDLQWCGFADFDTIEDPRTGELLIMELNPRVPACVKSAVVSGLDWGEILLNEYLNRPRKQYSYRRGCYLRHLGFELLWFFHSRNRFKTNPGWFRFFGKDIYYQDGGWDDPLPFVGGMIGNGLKLFSPTLRKSKSGLR